MGNIDEGNTLCLQLTDDAEQGFGFLGRQRSRRFIQDQDLQILGCCLGDLDDLSLGRRQARDRSLRIDIHAEGIKDLLGSSEHLLIVDDDAVTRQIAHEDILDHRQVLRQVLFLIDRAYAVFLGLFRGDHVIFLAKQSDRTAGRNIRSGQALY